MLEISSRFFVCRAQSAFHSALSYYQILDMSPQSWSVVGHSIVQNETMYQQYAADFYKGVPQAPGQTASAQTLACEVLTSTRSQQQQCNGQK
jgi:hypothetical protein